ncbi:hypothetical protein HRJ34_05690 [Rhizorhabdus wittichii]|uniref:Tetratricopeptide repeat protein n=2 Tax=Rhizorhabdus wittichii TaxID=160791 RepID=A0A975HF48_9SPHN|nr:hypothetical protein HRJ34_05690 [Rhizorhabdus wittichii]
MMGRSVRLLPALALALAVAYPIRAQNLPADTARQEAIGRAQQAAAADDCAGVLGALDPLVPGLAQGDQRTLIQRLRLICLGREGRFEELAEVQHELTVAMPRDGTVRAFGVIIALGEERFADAADQLATLAASSPSSLNILTGAAVREISTRLQQSNALAVRNRMMIALARADWEPSDIPELRTGFAEGAISALLDEGQPDEAEGLLERIEQPELLSSMLVDRHYAPIWRAVESRLGPAGGLSVDNFARDKLGTYVDMPTSDTALRDAANAMLLLGRYPDLIDMTDDVAVREGMSRDEVQTVLMRARALAVLGRTAEADRVLAPFMTLDPARSPEIVTALITYPEFLDETGQSARALETARAVRDRGASVINGFGMRWVDRTEICALSALGRTAEAGAAIDRLKPRFGENHAALIESLLCAKRDAEASEFALKAFADKDAGTELIYQFQPEGSIWGAGPSRLRDLWTAFLARPAIKAAFEKRGRILPRAYWPGAKPREIPRRPAAGENLT